MAVPVNSGGIDTPSTTTDNAAVRWNGTDGGAIQNSGIIITDTATLQAGDGATSVPTFSFVNYPTTGLYYNSGFGFSINGNGRVQLGSGAATINVGSFDYDFVWNASGVANAFFCDAGSGVITTAVPMRAYAQTVTVSGTTKTLALTDANTIQECSNGSAQAITIPTNASVAIPVKSYITFEQHGAGVVSITGASGVSINGNTESGGSESTVSISAQWGAVTLRKIGTNAYIAYGSI